MLNVVIPTTKQRRERLSKVIEALRECKIPHLLVIYENSDGGWVKATRNAVSNLKGLCLILGDDCIPQTNSIETLYNEYLKTFPEMDGLAQPDDGILHGEVATFPMISADNLMKYMYEGYHHNYADQELSDQFKKLGKYLYVPEAKFEHQHWTNGAEKDETYKLQEDYHAHDINLYNSRKHLWN